MLIHIRNSAFSLAVCAAGCSFPSISVSDAEFSYDQIYKAVSDLNPDDFSWSSDSGGGGFEDGSASFFLCSAGYNISNFTTGDTTLTNLSAKMEYEYTKLAIDLVNMRRRLRAFEVLDNFENTLAEYESVALTYISQIQLEGSGFPDYDSDSFRLVEQLISDLNEQKVGGIDWGVGGECGDGEILVPIASDPAGARIWLIPEFDYKLCAVAGFNPDDKDNCRWREETGRDVILVSGAYKFFASWPDGRTSQGMRNFDSELGGGENSMIVIRP
jgi:hypothetical protein